MASTSGFGIANGTRDVAHKAERAAESAVESKGGERLARIGIATKGVVFVMIGFLASEIALGHGGKQATTKGVILQLDGGPLGKVLLGVAAFGLAAYGLFLAVQSVLDTNRLGHGAAAIVRRVGDFIAAISYGTLASFAMELMLGSTAARDTTESDTHHWTARLMAMDAGRYIVGGIGLVVIAIGIGQLVTPYRAKFRENFDRGRLPQGWLPAVVTAGRIGYTARSIVYSTIGFFIAKAALHHDSRQVRGFQGALGELQSLSYGPYVLGLVALGFAIFGAYCLVDARYRCVFPHKGERH
ncbi:MAG: DUF1206 domain-containing protein [Polyangiales bacterium]